MDGMDGRDVMGVGGWAGAGWMSDDEGLAMERWMYGRHIWGWMADTHGRVHGCQGGRGLDEEHSFRRDHGEDLLARLHAKVCWGGNRR